MSRAVGFGVAMLCALGSNAHSAMAQVVPVESSAPADASAQLAAEASFAEGVRLMKAQQCAEAIEKFRESERFEAASGTLLDLAYCELQLGRIASAWLAYRRAIPLAEQTNKPSHAKIAREQADKLEAELPRLSILVAGGTERSLTIELDDMALAPGTWSVPIPVDPGEHRVEATLENGTRWSARAKATRFERVVVEVPLAEPGPRPATGLPPTVVLRERPAATPEPTPPLRAAAVAHPPWALGMTLAGAGIVLGGSALFVSARLQYDRARAHCSGSNVCAEADFNAQESAIGRARLSAVLLGGGLVVTGVGTLAYLTWGHAASGTSASLTSFGGPRDWTATVRGHF